MPISIEKLTEQRAQIIGLIKVNEEARLSNESTQLDSQLDASLGKHKTAETKGNTAKIDTTFTP